MAKNDNIVDFNEISRLSASTELKGTMISSSDIRIDGKFEGMIVTEGKVLIGESSEVKGDVIARSADVWGKIEGSVVIGDALSLKDGCSLAGNAETVRLSVETGSAFNGSCKMITAEEFEKKLKAAKGVKTQDSGMTQPGKGATA